jgi:peptidoglycan hydrolase CwlO-like protein
MKKSNETAQEESTNVEITISDLLHMIKRISAHVYRSDDRTTQAHKEIEMLKKEIEIFLEIINGIENIIMSLSKVIKEYRKE